MWNDLWSNRLQRNGRSLALARAHVLSVGRWMRQVAAKAVLRTNPAAFTCLVSSLVLLAIDLFS